MFMKIMILRMNMIEKSNVDAANVFHVMSIRPTHHFELNFSM